MKILVVCYSNTGTTMLVGEYIAQAMDAEFDVVEEVKSRPPLLVDGKKLEAGIGAFAKAVLAAVFGTSSAIARTLRDPGLYDLVVVGTPVWAGSLTPAVRSYLRRHRKTLPRVAFFCTAGDPSRMRVFGQMRKLVGKEPLATIAVKSTDVRTEACPRLIEAFVSRLKATG